MPLGVNPAEGFPMKRQDMEELIFAPPWQKQTSGYKMELKMETAGNFENYAIALWELPAPFAQNPDPERIQTNAKEFVLVKNTDGEYHMVLFFDLAPDYVLNVELQSP